MLTTTRCCSALALLLGFTWVSTSAQPSTAHIFPAETLWTKSAGEPLRAEPLLDASVGYLPLGATHLAKYDLSTGDRLWTIESEARSRPAADDGAFFSEVDGAIAAQRAEDASPIWRSALDAPLAVPLVVDHGWLVAGTTDGEVLCMRASDGQLLWRRSVGALHASPVVGVDRIYLPLADARVVALRLNDGAPMWERRLGGAANDVLALDLRLYLGSDDDYFYCLDTKDGKVQWRFRTGGDVIGVPLIDEARVYFVSLDNILRALDRRSGSQTWRRQLPLRPSFGPVFAADAVVVGGSARAMQAYRAKDGAPLGEAPAAAPLAAPPHVMIAADGSLRLIGVTNDVLKGASVIAFGPKPAPPPGPGTATTPPGPAARTPGVTPTMPPPGTPAGSPRTDDTP